MVFFSSAGKCLAQQMQRLISQEREIYIYGAGIDAARFLKLYPRFKVTAFCDKDAAKQKKGFLGHTVIAPEKLLIRINQVNVLISSSTYHEEIENSLLAQGWEKAYILNTGKMIADLYKLQYFENIVPIGRQEVFVDAGCFNGDTALNFIKKCNNEFKKILAFEPDLQNYRNCSDQFNRLKEERIQLYHGGLWDSHCYVSFQATGDQGARFAEKVDSSAVQAFSLDAVAGAEHASFIKMDIEGAELKAIYGAKGIILANRPKLAICIYHKPEDIFTIPAALLDLIPNYRFYLRHYSFGAEETVLYAV
jgi:FkbM family methyltransferase